MIHKMSDLMILYHNLNFSIWVSVADPGISKLGGGGGGRIFRSKVCFDAPSHIPYVFVAKVVNKIHNI